MTGSGRVLKPGGAFVCITYGPPGIRLGLFADPAAPFTVLVYAIKKPEGDTRSTASCHFIGPFHAADPVQREVQNAPLLLEYRVGTIRAARIKRPSQRFVEPNPANMEVGCHWLKKQSAQKSTVWYFWEVTLKGRLRELYQRSLMVVVSCLPSRAEAVCDEVQPRQAALVLHVLESQRGRSPATAVRRT